MIESQLSPPTIRAWTFTRLAHLPRRSTNGLFRLDDRAYGCLSDCARVLGVSKSVLERHYHASLPEAGSRYSGLETVQCYTWDGSRVPVRLFPLAAMEALVAHFC